MNAQALNYLIFGGTVIYIAMIVLLARRIRERHQALWSAFAGKGILAASGPIDSYRFVRTGLYALLQGDHWQLRDRMATALVFAIRALFLVLIVLIAIYVQVRGELS